MTERDRPVILVTGSSGLLGSAVIDALTGDYDVVAAIGLAQRLRPRSTAFWL